MDLDILGCIVEHTKFLGIYIDSHLSWSNHIHYLKTKLSKGIGIIRKARKLVNKEILLTLYNSLIFPYLNYCLEVWGSARYIHMNPLIVLQKRVVRLIYCVSDITHTRPIFLKLKLLTIRELHLYKVGLLMFKVFHNMRVPKFIIDFFTTNAEFHAYNTRHATFFRIPNVRTDITRRTFRFLGVKVWNLIISNIDFDVPIGRFKLSLKDNVHSFTDI